MGDATESSRLEVHSVAEARPATPPLPWSVSASEEKTIIRGEGEGGRKLQKRGGGGRRGEGGGGGGQTEGGGGGGGGRRGVGDQRVLFLLF